MTSINIRFLDFWGHFDKEGFLLTIALRDVCNRLSITVNIVDENIEYQSVDSDIKDIVVFSVFGESHWFVPDSAIKIFYTGENICPDFNACDYALGFERLEFGDRYLRLPNYLATPHYRESTKLMEEKHLVSPKEQIKYVNRDFCSFVVSNDGGDRMRLDIYERIKTYKNVDSGGRYKNNIGGPVKDKLLFDSQHKFVIACENSKHLGYTTEKIVDAFAAKVVPIYWGDPSVTSVFNRKAFINVQDYDTLDDALNEIKRIDNDDEAYLSMLMEPALVCDEYKLVNQYNVLVEFTNKIVSELLRNRAARRCRRHWGYDYVDSHRRYLLDKKQSLSERLLNYIKKR